MITATTNPRVKRWLALAKRTGRESSDSFLVEGRRETERLSDHVALIELIWCPEYAGAKPPPEATLVSAAVFDRLSRRQHPDGVGAIFRRPPMDLTRFDPGPSPLVLVADGIEKPGNVGAMLRTADALGAAFIGSGLTTDLTNPNVIRAAQGSLLAMPTATSSSEEAASWAAEHTNVYVLRPRDSVSLWETDLTGATSVVIGSEADGVGQAWRGVGVGVSIPMSGSADSLNASVTAGIVLAEATRQRLTGTSTT